MKRIALLFLVGLAMAFAQPRQAAARSTRVQHGGQQRERQAAPRSTAQFAKSTAPQPSSALVDPNDRVFADVVYGGGWEMVLTFVNMSGGRERLTLSFYNDDGSTASVPLVNPDGSISAYTGVDVALDGNTSSELVVADVGKDVISGWAYVSLPAGVSYIAGQAVARVKDADGFVISESVESLTNTQDYNLFAPFDNQDGVSTSLVLINPGNAKTANIVLSVQDSSGGVLVRDRFDLLAGTRVTINLPAAYKATAGVSGKVRVSGDIKSLSAICFRVSDGGSFAYSPIFNWSGLLK